MHTLNWDVNQTSSNKVKRRMLWVYLQTRYKIPKLLSIVELKAKSLALLGWLKAWRTQHKPTHYQIEKFGKKKKLKCDCMKNNDQKSMHILYLGSSKKQDLWGAKLRGDEAGIDESLAVDDEVEIALEPPLSRSEKKSDDDRCSEADFFGEAKRLSGRICSNPLHFKKMVKNLVI